MGRRDLETIFLPSFKAAVTEAGARSVMAAYNEIDGIPNANNEDLLYEHLRNVRAPQTHPPHTSDDFPCVYCGCGQQWGFDGFVLSDEGAVSQLWTNHHTAASPLDAMVQFLTAGGNMQVSIVPYVVSKCCPGTDVVVCAYSSTISRTLSGTCSSPKPSRVAC